MRAIRTLLLGVLALAVNLPAQTPAMVGDTKSVEKTFAGGGDIQLRLDADDYRIVPTSGDHIVVSWDAGRGGGGIQAAINVSGTQATVETHMPHEFQHRPEITIQVPARSNLQVRVSAGDVTVGPVEGNLDVELHVGDLHVEVADPQGFAAVEASTHVGDLDAGPFRGQEKGWLGHSITWQGNGRYRLHAHVGTGDVVLAKARAEI